jgi:hypothetical protein
MAQLEVPPTDTVPNPRDCEYAWCESLSTQDWGNYEAATKTLLAHIPLDRILGAFERDPRDFVPYPSLRGELAPIASVDSASFAITSTRHFPTLFDRCVRLIVSPAVANAILQARLPMLAGDVAMPPRKRNSHLSPVRASPESVKRLLASQRTHSRWWVACCGCEARSGSVTNSHPCLNNRFTRRTKQSYVCPKLWFRRISERDGLRLAAWHWCDLLEQRYLCQPGTPSSEGYCVGLVELSWMRLQVNNATLSLAGIIDNNKAGILLSACCGIFTEQKFCQDIIQMQSSAQRNAARVYHPWYPQVMVYHQRENVCNGYDENGYVMDWKVVGFVEGDEYFLAQQYP